MDSFLRNRKNPLCLYQFEQQHTSQTQQAGIPFVGTFKRNSFITQKLQPLEPQLQRFLLLHRFFSMALSHNVK